MSLADEHWLRARYLRPTVVTRAPRFYASRANVHQLHACAALESLRVALVALAPTVEAERYGWAGVSDGVRSWAPGNGGGSAKGGHGDPVAQAVMSSVRDRCAKRAQWTHETLAWLVGRLSLPTAAPLDALAVALPRLPAATARELTLWLRELDERCRELVGLGDGLRHVAGLACPACDMRLVYRGPAGLYQCRNTICTCAGDACRCALPGRVAGVTHIWTPEGRMKP